jgi:hypothetical protein
LVTQEQRLLQLTAWLRGIGVCPLCALRLAILAVDHEDGLQTAIPNNCQQPTNCDAKARVRWAERPAKE